MAQASSSGTSAGEHSPAIFSVNERRLTDSLSVLWASLKGAFTFHKPITEGLGVTDWNGSESPKLNGKPLPMKNETATSLAILPDRSAFLLGTVAQPSAFRCRGKGDVEDSLAHPGTHGEHQREGGSGRPLRRDHTMVPAHGRQGDPGPLSPIPIESDGSSGPHPGTMTRPRGARTSSAGT